MIEGREKGSKEIREDGGQKQSWSVGKGQENDDE